MPPPSKQCLKRLQTELRQLIKEEAANAAKATGPGESSSGFITARPDPNNMLLWYFLVAGPEDTPYAGGRYVGTLRFPPDYPFKPPTIMILTPNGRFETDTALCMSNSSFHPEQWCPLWSVETIVQGFVSFMVSDEAGLGGITTSEDVRRRYARESRKFNVTNIKYIYERTLPDQYAADKAFLAAAAAAATAEDGPSPARDGTTPTAAPSAGDAATAQEAENAADEVPEAVDANETAATAVLGAPEAARREDALLEPAEVVQEGAPPVVEVDQPREPVAAPVPAPHSSVKSADGAKPSSPARMKPVLATLVAVFALAGLLWLNSQ